MHTQQTKFSCPPGNIVLFQPGHDISNYHEEIPIDTLFNKKILRVDEVARILGCSKGHIYNLASRGELVPRKRGGLSLYLLSEVMEWIDGGIK